MNTKTNTQTASTTREPKKTNEKPRKTRLFFIDNLRIALISLIVLHHLSITYGHSGGWYYYEGQPDDITVLVITLFTLVNQAFFLGFFYLISGYFTPGSYDRKGPWPFLKDRLLRLGIPLLFYIVFIDPIVEYAVASTVGNIPISFGEFLGQYFGNYRGLGLGPVWFIEVLLIFTIFYVVWRLVVKPSVTPPQRDGKPPSNLAIATFALLLGVVTFVVRIWLPLGWVFELLMLQFAYFPQYIALFVVGIIAYRQNWFLGIPTTTGKVWLGIAIILIVVLLPIMFILGGALEGNTDPFLGGVHWQSFAFSVWEQFVGMGMVVGLLVLFREKLNHQGKLAKDMAASAYTVFIIHAPVIVVLALALRGVTLPPLLKFVLVAPLALALCFILAHYIRKLPLARDIL
jgi:surface polysaccharide O-acyltransferase-like enzyme